MRLEKKTLLLPLLALVITGCTLSPSKRKKTKTSSSEISSDLPGTSQDQPTSEGGTSYVPTTSEGGTSTTPTTSQGGTSATPTTSQGGTSATPTTSSGIPTTSSQPSPSSSTPKPSSSVIPSTSQTPAVIHVTGVTISGDENITKTEGDPSFTLSYTVAPSNATDKSVTWTSSNTTVATVSNATVTIKAAGTTKITVTTNDQKKTDFVNLTVNPSGEIIKTKLKYNYDDYIANNAWPLDNCPLSGSPKLLIVPIWFSDSSSYIAEGNKETVRGDIQKAYLGSTSDTGWHSVKTFYQEESKGALTLTGTVTDWYDTKQSSSTYQSENSGGNATVSLVSTVVDWYFKNNSNEKKSDYDTNGDGYLDGVMLIYAHPDYSTYTQTYNNFWAYCYWLQPESPGTASSPKPNVFFWASYDFMYGSSNAASRTGKSSAATGDCSHCTLDAHTFIHEMGHVLGLEDYYDYYNTNLVPAGGFNMQDWNMGGHDPYSVMGYGWADPYIPTTTTTLTINDFQSSHDLILLSNHTVDSPFDEYILLEFYTPTGLNKLDSDYDYSDYPHGPQTSGIRIWHVDSRLTPLTSQEEFSENLITDPTKATYGATLAMSNSSGGDYASYLGEDYYDYNLLQFIRNDTNVSYKNCSNPMDDDDLFKAGSTFTWSKYSKQFVSSTKMNNGTAFGWTVTVDSISGSKATITVTKG